MHHPAAVAGIVAFAGLAVGFAVLAGCEPAYRMSADEAGATPPDAPAPSRAIQRLDDRLAELDASLHVAESERRRLEQQCSRLRIEIMDAERKAARAEGPSDQPRFAMPKHHDLEARLLDTLEQLRPVYEVIGRLRAEIADVEDEHRRLRRGERTEPTGAP